MKKTSSLVQAGIVLWAAFLLAALAGCNSKPGSDVMATVDGRKIFRSDVDKYYDNNVASAQQPPTGEQATALRLNILHQMIDDEILMRRAEKLGLLATDEEVDRKYNEIKAPFTQEEFDKRLQDAILDPQKGHHRPGLKTPKYVLQYRLGLLLCRQIRCV